MSDEDRIKITYTSAEEFEQVAQESGLVVNIDDMKVEDATKTTDPRDREQPKPPGNES